MSTLYEGAPPIALPEARQAQTLVLALGNRLRGDDGAGPAVLEALQASGEVPAAATLCDGGTPGLEAALILQGYRQAIVIDAADMGLEPGQWRRLTLSPGELRPGATLHAAGLREALALGEALGILPLRLVLFGIQPQQTGWAPGLSEPVRQAVPAVCRAILDEIGGAPVGQTKE